MVFSLLLVGLGGGRGGGGGGGSAMVDRYFLGNKKSEAWQNA